MAIVSCTLMLEISPALMRKKFLCVRAAMHEIAERAARRHHLSQTGIGRHKTTMAKARVTFKIKRIAEGDWNILAECPGVETVVITGLKSKVEADDWLNGERRIAWLRAHGYAK